MKKTQPPQSDAPLLRGPHNKGQLFQLVSPNDYVTAAHPVRFISDMVSRLNWTAYENRIGSRRPVGGRPALDPRVLATLWLYGMTQRVDSARELGRRCDSDLAYRWVLGGETINHHTLSDFLGQEAGLVEGLLSQVIGCLHRSGTVSFAALVVDGTKVKSRGGADSFADAAGLAVGLSRKLAALRSRGEGETARQRGARARAERQLLENHAKAVEMLERRQAGHRQAGRSRGRSRAAAEKVSCSDPESRRMRGADGGVRPSVNIQLGVCADSGAVLSVGACSRANDLGLAESAVSGMERLCGAVPGRVLADGGYGSRASVCALASRGILFYGPPRRSERLGAGVAPAVRAWHARWAAAGSWARRVRLVVERVIGRLKGWGLRRVPVHGLAGARRWALWHALAHNLLLLGRAG